MPTKFIIFIEFSKKIQRLKKKIKQKQKTFRCYWYAILYLILLEQKLIEC